MLRSFTDRKDGIRATCVDSNGRTRTFKADVLLACDGGNSTVRGLLGFEVDEQTYGPYFVLADVEFRELPLSPGETHYFLCRGGYLMVVPIPEGRHASSVLQGDLSGNEHRCAFLEAAIARRVGMKVRITDVAWTTRAPSDIACRGGHGAGNVFLAGDALHQFSPIGGTNMNVGIMMPMRLLGPSCDGGLMITKLTPRSRETASARDPIPDPRSGSYGCGFLSAPVLFPITAATVGG